MAIFGLHVARGPHFVLKASHLTQYLTIVSDIMLKYGRPSNKCFTLSSVIYLTVI